jgi:hypothetical protein
VALLGFEVSYDRYVQLRSPSNQELEFGIILSNHSLIPQEYQTAPSGMYVTFVVPTVNLVYRLLEV